MNESNLKNRTIFCDDNIDVLAGINSNCIDLIYLDPPFNKNKEFTAPLGSSAEGGGFKDIFRKEDLKEEWLLTIEEDQPELYQFLNGASVVGKPYNFAYLAYMAIRLLEMKRILKDTGSIYLHCDPTMGHYLKMLMDSIFGEENFRNEIIWKRTSSHNDSTVFGRVHDTLLFYGQPINADDIRVPLNPKHAATYKYEDSRGLYASDNLSAKGLSGGGYNYDFHGHRGPWRYPEKRILELEKDDRIHMPKKKGGVPRLKRYLHENKGQIPPSVWTDISAISSHSKERTGYPTQKPLALLERIIKASSNAGDLVLDPFCGCATTCVAAEKFDRQWVGIDVSVKAYELVQMRLERDVDKPQADWMKGDTALNMRVDPPARTDQGTDYREQKFVYVISHPNFPGEYKVGIAKDWKSRLNAYQTSDPERRYKIEFEDATPWFRETEKYIHDKFPNKHEWVQGDLKAIIKAIKGHKAMLQKGKKA